MKKLIEIFIDISFTLLVLSFVFVPFFIFALALKSVGCYVDARYCISVIWWFIILIVGYMIITLYK